MSREIFLVVGNTDLFNATPPLRSKCPLVEIEIEAEGASLRRFHHHLSAPWAALFWEESLLQSQFHVWGIESPEFQRRRSRGTSTLNSQISNLSFYRRLTIFPKSQQLAARSPRMFTRTPSHTFAAERLIRSRLKAPAPVTPNHIRTSAAGESALLTASR